MENVRKTFHCNKCMEKHEKPVNSKCQRQDVLNDECDTSFKSDTKSKTSALSQHLSMQILTELKHLSGHIQQVEDRVGQQESSKRSPSSTSQLPENMAKPPVDDMVLPTVLTLRRSTDIQREVDARLQELRTLNEQGKFKSQRGGSDTVYCKNDVPWPHNYILTGNSLGPLMTAYPCPSGLLGSAKL